MSGSGGAPQLDEDAHRRASENHLRAEHYRRALQHIASMGGPAAEGPQAAAAAIRLAREALAASPGAGELVALNRDDREWLVELIDHYDETHGARDREDWPGSYKRYMALRARLDRKDEGK
jgi:lipase chaperone LimK